ncbi:hypothetical protein LIU39_08330 [Streptomyces sp. SF28]|nr:IclR family transcriptional regulator C-terminal domain-containing protein [Streptomyces pinistramenti]MCB5907418.1 hypothetical protein [Streptomyces pinistramenti]
MAGLCLYAPYGPCFALVTALAPAGVSGAAVALVNSLGALGSFAGTYLVGWIRGTSLGDGGAFALMAAGTLLSAALVLAVREPRTPPARVPRPGSRPPREPHTGLPAIAGILSDRDVLLVLTAQGTQHLQLHSAEGTRNAWHATSLGKALVAALPPNEREELLTAGLRQATDRTPTDPDALRAELDRVRAQGWAEADEESEVGVRSIAVPVPAPTGDAPRLAVSLSAAVALTEPDALRSHVPALHACAEEIAAHMDH